MTTKLTVADLIRMAQRTNLGGKPIPLEEIGVVILDADNRPMSVDDCSIAVGSAGVRIKLYTRQRGLRDAAQRVKAARDSLDAALSAMETEDT